MQTVEAATTAEIPNPYLPYLMRIVGMHTETPDVRTLQLEFADPETAAGFTGWDPGQFAEFTVFGSGECVFALANTWTAGEPIECTFRAIGKVTRALRSRSLGQMVGLRGPYGNAFPVADWEGRDLVFLGGGIGMAALRAALLHVLAHRDRYGEVVVLNGARSVADMVYKDEMPAWQSDFGVEVVRTVDPGGQSDGWDGEVGLIPQVFEGLERGPDNRVVIACGPPVMLHFLFLSLDKLGYSPDQVVTTLENKMKCGIGHCGRCNVGPFYVCRDGPVVTWRQIQALPKDL
jgi:NAD(P)H-flavin reductase